MRTLLPTLLCLCLLAVIGFGCNKDTAGANSDKDTFLAPAAAPDVPERTPVNPEDMAKVGMKEQEAVDDGSEDIVKLTPEDEAAAKRMGPGRVAPPPATKSGGTPVTANTKPNTMPVPEKPKKPVLDYDRALVTISKTACYGGEGCRQFSLELTNDRRLVLDAKKNMDRSGKYTRLLSATEYNRLLSAMEATQPSQLGAVYPKDTKTIPADAQATVLRYADVYGEARKVEVYSDAPKRLAEFLADLEKWVDTDGWAKAEE